MNPGAKVAYHRNKAKATRLGRLGLWLRSQGGRRAVAIGLAILVLTGGLFTWAFWPNDAAAEQKFVALYVTDLPGDLEKLEITIATATVGARNHALDVEIPILELSALQGPQEAMRVASGFVPLANYDGSISLIFADARGYKHGQWVSIDIPQARLTLENGLPPGDFREVASLMDFDLDTSLVMDGGGGGTFEFRPYVKNVYQYGGNETRISNVDNSVHSNSTLNLTSLLDIDLEDLIEIQLPTQMLERIADELVKNLVDELCGRLKCDAVCSPMPMCLGAAGNYPPLVPFDPIPPSGSLGVSITPLLGWTSGDPENDPVSYRVLLNDQLVCTADEATCQPGQLAPNATMTWHVVALDNHGGTTLSPKWTFTTMAQGVDDGTNHLPNIPSNPVPAQGLTHIVSSPTLSWTGGDRDGDLVVYRVTVDGRVVCTTRETQCAVSSLLAGAKVTWSVVATDAQGGAQAGPMWEFTVLGKDEKPRTNRAPNAPSAPSPANGATSPTLSVVLGWTGSDVDADSLVYRVLFDDVQELVKVGCDWQPTSTCVAANLAPGKSYYWKVEARDPHRATNESATWSFRTGSNSAPNVPVPASPQSGATINNLNPSLSWTGGDPDGDEVTYSVAVDQVVKCPEATQTSCSLTGLANGATYSWTVSATDQPKIGFPKTTTAGPWTFTIDTSIANHAPDKPMSPFPTNAASGLATVSALTWAGDDPDTEALQFQVKFGTLDPPTSIQCPWSSQRTCALPSLEAGTRYYWFVESRDAKETTTGPVWYFTMNSPPNAPSSPGPIDGKVSPTQNGDTSVTLSWTGSDPEGHTLQYRVFAESDEASPKALRCDWSASMTCSSGIYLKPGVWTYWRVEARDSVGQVQIGPTWKFQIFEGSAAYQAPLSDNRDLHDPSPSAHTPELVRTLSFTPGLNQYVRIDRIEGMVAYDGSGKLGALAAKIVGFDASPLGVASKKSPDPTAGPDAPTGPGASNVGAEPTVAYCSLKEYTSGTRGGIGYQGGVGQIVTVEFYLYYVPPSNVQTQYDSVTDVCLDDLVVNYQVITP